MCAYKLVTSEFDYWPLSSTIEPFMHTYEHGIFLNANRSMFCWIDDWHGLTEEDVKVYEVRQNRVHVTGAQTPIPCAQP